MVGSLMYPLDVLEPLPLCNVQVRPFTDQIEEASSPSVHLPDGIYRKLDIASIGSASSAH